RRRAAPSTPAALMPRRAARSNGRCCARSRRATAYPATWSISARRPPRPPRRRRAHRRGSPPAMRRRPSAARPGRAATSRGAGAPRSRAPGCCAAACRGSAGRSRARDSGGRRYTAAMRRALPPGPAGWHSSAVETDLLPPRFAAWFAARGWVPHPHQLRMLAAARAGRSALLVAPTGGGKTLAGFLPSLVALAERPGDGLHTLYLSPLKALAVDILRNLERPVAELGLPVRLETRTGDTPAPKRARQRADPPHLLMTTPESLALLLSYGDAADLFAGLREIVVDELHALVGNKRGDLLSLGLARLARLAPAARRVGLSATVAWPDALADYLAGGGEPPLRITAPEAAPPEISILVP